MTKWIFLLRAFFPSWRFFDDVGPELRLEIRFGSSADRLGNWQVALSPIRRKLSTLFVNPEGGFLHACHNLLNHLSFDIQESESIGDRASYKITNNLARAQTLELAPAARAYQFRLLAGDLGEILLSPVCEV